MGLLNNTDPIFFYHKSVKTSSARGFDGVVTPSGLLGFCVLVFLSAFLIWLIRPLIRRLRGKPFQIERQPSRAWLLAGLVGTLYLVFLISLPLSLWLYGGWKLAYGVSAFAFAVLSLPPIATVLTLGLAVFTVLT